MVPNRCDIQIVFPQFADATVQTHVLQFSPAEQRIVLYGTAFAVQYLHHCPEYRPPEMGDGGKRYRYPADISSLAIMFCGVLNRKLWEQRVHKRFPKLLYQKVAEGLGP
jgi:hypothetical protein